MKLTVIGSSPAWPNPGSAHAGYLVESGGRSLLLDCGPGVLARLRANGGWPELDAIVISHFHLDHFGDLVAWVWGVLNGRGVGTQPDLWVPRGGRATLDATAELFGHVGMFDRVFVVHEYDTGVPFTAAGFMITGLRVPHYTIEAHGLRIENGESILAYSGDSAPCEALAELARDADLFLCEATLADGAIDGTPRGHLSLAEARAAFAKAEAKRLLVTHRPAELPADGADVAHDGVIVEF